MRYQMKEKWTYRQGSFLTAGEYLTAYINTRQEKTSCSQVGFNHQLDSSEFQRRRQAELLRRMRQTSTYILPILASRSFDDVLVVRCWVYILEPGQSRASGGGRINGERVSWHDTKARMKASWEWGQGIKWEPQSTERETQNQATFIVHSWRGVPFLPVDHSAETKYLMFCKPTSNVAIPCMKRNENIERGYVLTAEGYVAATSKRRECC
jgi:hypothetical protein